MTTLDDHLLSALVDDPSITAEALLERARRHEPLRPLAELTELVGALRRRADGLATLGPALSDPAVTEVMVTGHGAWVERDGVLEPLGLTLDRSEIDVVVERVLRPLGLRVDPSSPMVDARLPDGSRVNVVVPPLSIDGPALTIRRFPDRDIPLRRFVEDPTVRGLLERAVRARRSMLVVGGTGAGKTTLLNALAASIDPAERIVTVEDTAELRLPHPHVVRLEARPANAEGVGRVTVGELLRNALRMRPDRIVVGELRGAEALDLLLALNTGHDGSLATCHATTAAGALERLALLATLARPGLDAELVRPQIATGLDLVVVVQRTPAGRVVREVAEVDDADGRPVARTVWCTS